MGLRLRPDTGDGARARLGVDSVPPPREPAHLELWPADGQEVAMTTTTAVSAVPVPVRASASASVVVVLMRGASEPDEPNAGAVAHARAAATVSAVSRGALRASLGDCVPQPPCARPLERALPYVTIDYSTEKAVALSGCNASVAYGKSSGHRITRSHHRAARRQRHPGARGGAKHERPPHRRVARGGVPARRRAACADKRSGYASFREYVMRAPSTSTVLSADAPPRTASGPRGSSGTCPS